MSSVALAFSTEVGQAFVECLDMEEWLSFAVSLGSHGVSGKTISFPFGSSEAFMDTPELAGRLA